VRQGLGQVKVGIYVDKIFNLLMTSIRSLFDKGRSRIQKALSVDIQLLIWRAVAFILLSNLMKTLNLIRFALKIYINRRSVEVK